MNKTEYIFKECITSGCRKISGFCLSKEEIKKDKITTFK